MTQMLRKTTKFSWNETWENIFSHLKEFLSSPDVFQKPRQNLSIVVYLAISEEAISAALVHEINKEEGSVYLVSRTLHAIETKVPDDRKVSANASSDHKEDATVLPKLRHNGKEQLPYI